MLKRKLQVVVLADIMFWGVSSKLILCCMASEKIFYVRNAACQTVFLEIDAQKAYQKRGSRPRCRNNQRGFCSSTDKKVVFPEVIHF